MTWFILITRVLFHVVNPLQTVFFPRDRLEFSQITTDSQDFFRKPRLSGLGGGWLGGWDNMFAGSPFIALRISQWSGVVGFQEPRGVECMHKSNWQSFFQLLGEGNTINLTTTWNGSHGWPQIWRDPAITCRYIKLLNQRNPNHYISSFTIV